MNKEPFPKNIAIQFLEKRGKPIDSSHDLAVEQLTEFATLVLEEAGLGNWKEETQEDELTCAHGVYYRMDCVQCNYESTQ